jgi:hypothetical protein
MLQRSTFTKVATYAANYVIHVSFSETYNKTCDLLGVIFIHARRIIQIKFKFVFTPAVNIVLMNSWMRHCVIQQISANSCRNVQSECSGLLFCTQRHKVLLASISPSSSVKTIQSVVTISRPYVFASLFLSDSLIVFCCRSLFPFYALFFLNIS